MTLHNFHSDANLCDALVQAQAASDENGIIMLVGNAHVKLRLGLIVGCSIQAGNSRAFPQI
jgi:hypothetical protein